MDPLLFAHFRWLRTSHCRSDFFGFSLYPRTPVELEPGHLDEGALAMQSLMQARPWTR